MWMWIYVIIFLIIFAETWLVVTPFLPWDSFLFALWAIASTWSLNVFILFAVINVAALLWDITNYTIGKFIWNKAFTEKSKFFKKEYLIKTEKFYEKYGHKAIIIARFMPIVRTFAPFVAGIWKMSYLKFIGYSIIGSLLWTTSFIFWWYLFWNIPIIKNNFTVVILIIIVASILPGIIEVIKHKYWK